MDTLIRGEVDAAVTRAKIIISTAGPFSLYGEQVIASCAEHGTHYLDITGEVGFIRQMMDKYGDTARKNKAKIIPFCGFDSIPADVGAYLISKKFDPQDEVSIKAYYSISSGVNGGTIASMMNKFESGEYKEMNDPRRIMDGNKQRIHKPEKEHFFGFSKLVKRWSTPFIMGAINSKVVYRTASLMRDFDTPYFKSISYSEHSRLGKWYNPIPLISMGLTMLLINMLGPQKWFRKLLLKFTPAPGEGPSEKAIENGYIYLFVFARNREEKEGRLSFSYGGDPSNKSTVFFLCESALVLATRFGELPGFDSRFGFLTPVSAMGDVLVNQLTRNGYQIEE